MDEIFTVKSEATVTVTFSTSTRELPNLNCIKNREFLLLTFLPADVIIKLAQNSIPHMLNVILTCSTIEARALKIYLRVEKAEGVQ